VPTLGTTKKDDWIMTQTTNVRLVSVGVVGCFDNEEDEGGWGDIQVMHASLDPSIVLTVTAAIFYYIYSADCHSRYFLLHLRRFFLTMKNGSLTTVMAEPPTCPGSDDKRSTDMNTIAVVATKLGPHDVLMGRGTPAMTHTGNVAFRRLVASRKLDYVQALRRREKDGIAREIVASVKSRDGLFLRKIDSSSVHASKEHLIAGIPKGESAWMTVSEEAVLLKVKQALRDGGGGSSDSCPVTVQQDKAQAHRAHRKRSHGEIEPTTAIMLRQKASAVNNLNVAATAPSYLQKLVADTLQAYQEQCRKRNQRSKRSQILEHHHHNHQKVTHEGCSQSVEETAATNKAHPTNDIAGCSSPTLASVHRTSAKKGLDILQKTVTLLDRTGDDDDDDDEDMPCFCSKLRHNHSSTRSP
jgi:hypothetical protein